MFVYLVKNLTRFIRNSLLLHFPFTAERFARLEFGAKSSIICSTSTSKLYLFNIVLSDIADSDVKIANIRNLEIQIADFIIC